jgi:hypothetical protein
MGLLDASFGTTSPLREFRESHELELWSVPGAFAEFELLFVDFQDLDPGLEGR